MDQDDPHALLKTCLGHALREARERTPGIGGRCLSQNAVGQAAGGVDSRTISGYELAQRGIPPDAVVHAYARLTGTTYYGLYTRAMAYAADEAKRRGELPQPPDDD